MTLKETNRKEKQSNEKKGKDMKGRESERDDRKMKGMKRL